MIFLPHHIEGGNGQGAFAEVTHQRVDLGGEAEPAFEFLLAELAGLAAQRGCATPDGAGAA